MSASLAFVFPGQGSQSLGMLAELGAQQALVRDTFAEASEALGYDLWALVQNGPEERLNQTDKTQPAILTVSIALWRLWLAEGGARPAFVAGHSLGEYSALVAAESPPVPRLPLSVPSRRARRAAPSARWRCRSACRRIAS